MKKSISLSIKMDHPCKQNWEEMDVLDGSRFCDSCQKAVIDFTSYTGQELFKYFIEHPGPVCGRIENKQNIDRLIAPVEPPVRFHLSPVAATLLTISTLTTDANTRLNTPQELTQLTVNNNSASPIVSDSIVISGIVKDDAQKPIANARVDLNEQTVLTDTNGFYQFILPTEMNKAALLQYSYGNLTREVRNYHPAMGTSKFDVVMYEPRKGISGTLGIMLPQYYFPDSLSKLSLKFTDKLDSKTRLFLKNLSTSLKQNPEMNIVLLSYYKSNKSKAEKFTEMIKSYLVRDMGISPDRIMINEAEFSKNNPFELTIEFNPTF